MPLHPAARAADTALTGWSLALLPAGQVDSPAALAQAAAHWLPARVPGTAMGALFDAGTANLDHLPALDAQDAWYRCTFDAPPPAADTRRSLVFKGLATLAQVWLNGAPLLDASNMFLAHEIDVEPLLRAQGNALVIRFASVAQSLQQRRPRPRWRTRLVEQQQLRWLRTGLLGYIPGWTPAAPAIGPWRPVALRVHAGLAWDALDARAVLQGDAGVVQVEGTLRTFGPRPLAARLDVGDAQAALHVVQQADGRWHVSGHCTVAHARRWWPHTHGEPALYPVTLTVVHGDSSNVLALGATGFREIALYTADDGFALRVNGVPVFCRGACWTPTDVIHFAGSEAATRDALLLARDAGMNMLRVGGTMVYETDAFYASCDELGILLWHDFMFASMDYPADDAGFAASADAEARQFLRRTQLSPSIALLCGNSEVEQQAAMVGADPALWRNRLFAEVLPAAVQALRPDVPWWPSSPAGGVLPFQVDAGAAHYFGVGAYLQPLTDARRSGLRFASECLAFANVPEPDNLDALSPTGAVPPQHPRWKARVPRDGGAGWDFDDVRDHYLATLFGVDPMRLRHADTERYLALSRVASGEAMAAAVGEWRRHGASCAGALVWFLRDLWPGAGWGVVDSDGQPKAAWHYLRRAMAPVALFIANEGASGLVLHAVNDTPHPLRTQVSLTLYRHGTTAVAQGSQTVRIPAHGSLALRGDALLGRFTDAAYTYRFGPPGHDVAWAALHDDTGTLRSADVFFPLGHGFAVQPSVGLEADVRAAGEGFDVTVRARQFAQAVRVDAPGFRADSNYFHLEPGGERTVRLAPQRPGVRLQGLVEAINTAERVRLAAPRTPRA